MHILIIGAAGMVGRKLAARLTADGQLGGKPITEMTLVDVVTPQGPEGFAGKVNAKEADLSSPGEAEALVATRPDAIFHLAAIVSGEAELDFEKGYRINLDGTRYLFDAIRLANGADGYKPRVVFTSSIAVVGAPLPYPIPDEYHTTPLTSYGTQKAIAVHIFPENQRGAAEGFRPWDLRANSTMTNATVAETVKGTDGQNITVKYKDGEKKVVVPPGTPIVTFVAGDKSELKPGAKIIIFGAMKKDDGTLEANRVNVGRDGITPPM